MVSELDRIHTTFVSAGIIIITRIFPVQFVVGYLAPNTAPSLIMQPHFTNSNSQPTNFQAQPAVQYQVPVPQNDNMQANLKILLSYLNDEAVKKPFPSSINVGGSVGSPNSPMTAQNQLKFPETVNLPTNFGNRLIRNRSPTAPIQNFQTYTPKVRRMAVPTAQTMPQNLMNFLQNDATNNYNGMINGPSMDWANSELDRNDDGIFGNNDEELAGADENEEKPDSTINGSQLKFSKLAKPVQPSEANRAVFPPKLAGGPKAPGIGNDLNGNSSPNANANNNLSQKPQTKAPSPTTKFPTPPSSSKPSTALPTTASSSSNGSGPQRSGGKLNSGMMGGGSGSGANQIIGVGLVTPQNNKNGPKPGNANVGSPNTSKTAGNSPQTQQQIVPSILLPQSGNPTEQIPSPHASQQSQSNNSGTNSSKHNFKLIYFDARGICEPIRLLFHYAKVPFEDSRITRRQWLALKDSTVYGKVPILEVDGKPLTYCHTISRFLARTFGLAGTSSWEQAKVDEISDFHSDVAMDLQPYLYVVAGFHQGDREALRKAIFLPGVEKHFPVYVNLLKQSGSGYFVGSGLTWIDFVISEYMTTIKHFEPAILDKYPAITKFVRKVQSLPQIFDYIANREHQPVK